MKKIYSVNEALKNFLELLDIEYIVGIPGSNLDFLIHINSSKIKIIVPKHEQIAGFIASGFYKASGKKVACFASVGPGATNLVTAVSCAYYDSVPLIVITSQVSRANFGKNMFQESTGMGRTISQLNIFKEITLFSKRIEFEKELIFAMRKIIEIFNQERTGPVYLEIPFDMGKNEIEIDFEDLFKNKNKKQKISIKNLIEKIKFANQPLILIGGGVNSKNYSSLLTEIINQSQIPFATTLKGKGAVSDDNLLCLGMIGIMGHNEANNYCRESDLYIIIGASLHNFSTKNETLINKGKIIFRIDAKDPDRFSYSQNEIILEGNTKLILEEVLNQLKKSKIRKNIQLKENLSHFIKKNQSQIVEHFPIKPSKFVLNLNKYLPKDLIICSESVYWTGKYLLIKNNQSHIVLTGFASIGASSGEAIGAKLANPNKTVISFQGDCGFLMGGFAPLTSRDYKIPVIYCVLVNGTMGPIYHAQKNKDEIPFTKFMNPNYEYFARSLNLKYYKITKISEMSKILEQVLKDYKEENSIILEVIVDPEEYFI